LNDNLRLLELAEKVSDADKRLEKLKSDLGDMNYVDLMERKGKINSTILDIMSKVTLFIPSYTCVD
jgi:hypothetical protein